MLSAAIFYMQYLIKLYGIVPYCIHIVLFHCHYFICVALCTLFPVSIVAQLLYMQHMAIAELLTASVHKFNISPLD